MEWVGVVLAAGMGKRMRSRLPKVLHPLAGRPILAHVVESVRRAGVASLVIVAPAERRAFEEAVEGPVEWAVQDRPLGTGHALLSARPQVEGRARDILVVSGDAPLLRPETVRALMDHHRATGASLTLLTASPPPQEGLGRVVRDSSGRVVAVVEEDEAPEEVRALPEVNAGAYCLRAGGLWERLQSLRPSPLSGEVPLPGLVALLARGGERVEALRAPDPREALGINTRLHLAEAEAVLRQRVCRRWMEEGVTILHPPSTFIDDTVEIGRDTVIYPNTYLLGRTRIGEGCRLGPNTLLQDCTLGEGCAVVASVLEGAVLEGEVEVGPFSHLRPGSYIERGVHLGNFVEVKKSRLGRGTRAGHFCYIGDATIGREVNIGAGTITCNYDGVRKNPTEIEEGAFIGSDTMLVAPVRVGAGAVTGAGSVVTRDVPPGAVVAGVPARPLRKRSQA